MTKAKLILIIAFVVTLAAGVVVGFTIRSLPHRPPMPFAGGPPPHNHFPDLKLSAEQKAKMDEIWSAVMRDSREIQSKQRQAFQKQREEAVRAILTEEQKVKYDEVLKDYASKMAELGKAREKAFQEAVEKTKLILNAEQRKKYEEWLKSWHEERHPGGPPPEPMEPPPTHTEEHTATGSGT
jgi:Spy/CpxP family protein refolding chaperone